MNILYISSHDIVGQQFNGYLLYKALKENGHTTNMIVGQKDSNEADIYELANGPFKEIDKLTAYMEKELGFYSLMNLSSAFLHSKPYYRSADIIHLQLLHATPFFNLLNIPLISRKRPTLWTMHDPWLLSGHCVHPLDCDRWLTGCGNCPDLALPIPIKRDATAFMSKVKEWVMHHSALTLIVTSAWMQRKVSRSPIVSHLPSKFIPFGVDRGVFRPKDKASSRSRFQIPPDAHVLMFRNAPYYVYKGTDYVLRALDLFIPHKTTYLLTLDAPYGLDSLRHKYKLVNLGWINDRDLLVDALNAADIFLMPSVAETFGMMAVESMACGTPVIVFEGTSLPDVIRAPRGGIAVPYKDYKALCAVICELLEKPEYLRSFSKAALNLIEEEYTLELYVKRHLELYESFLSHC
jgi:glycosyltransferase involved in cell wall biosynthesis